MQPVRHQFFDTPSIGHSSHSSLFVVKESEKRFNFYQKAYTGISASPKTINSRLMYPDKGNNGLPKPRLKLDWPGVCDDMFSPVYATLFYKAVGLPGPLRELHDTVC